MGKYAVLQYNKKQYKVEEGKEVLFDLTKEEKIDSEVLLVADGAKVEIGTPVIKNASVSIKKIAEVQGEKVKVFTYKAKSRHRKSSGFRPVYTKVLIEKISSK